MEQYNRCEDVKNYFTHMTVPEAAAVWCGIPKEEIKEILGQCKPLGENSEYNRHILIHPYIECLGYRCRLLQDAINDNLLKVGRDGSRGFIQEHDRVAYSRRTINRSDLKEFIREHFPADMPKTLFDEVERKAHAAISADAYLALQAELEAKKAEIMRLQEKLRAVQSENESKDYQIQSMEKMIAAQPKAESTADLLIIGAIIGASERKKAASGHDGRGVQAALVNLIIEQYPTVSGLSKSQLDRRFAAANAFLKQKIK